MRLHIALSASLLPDSDRCAKSRRRMRSGFLALAAMTAMAE
ncbi:hypothetical protein [Janthinobacterium sp. 1_2014MBL_MicDiv]|nr:hypothetical protein [Janthinobacterium sp. 1_2014MBL_MicDiv]